LPICTLSVVQRVPRSTMVYVAASPPTIPDGRLSRVRCWPRLCTPCSRDRPARPLGSFRLSLPYTPHWHGCAAPSSPRPQRIAPSAGSGCMGSPQDHRVPSAPVPGVSVPHHQGDLPRHRSGRSPAILAPPGSGARPPSSPRLGAPSVVGSGQVVARPCGTLVLPALVAASGVEVLGPLPRRVRQVRLPLSSPTPAASRHGKHVRHTGKPLQGACHRARRCGAAVMR
jgi:hypothetical protein